MLCTQCGTPLTGGDEAALFVCPACGLVHEVGAKTLGAFPASTVGVTSELATSGPVQYLAVWRLLPAGTTDGDPLWEHIRRVAAPGPAYLFVPAFSLARQVVQRIGVRLTEVQPVLELTAGAPVGHGPRPALAAARSDVTPLSAAAAGAAPDARGRAALAESGEDQDFEGVSPILVGRREACGLAQFIYMALEARETHDLRPADLGLEPDREDLLFFPAVWDPRYVHESNWRLLLREFDGLVA